MPTNSVLLTLTIQKFDDVVNARQRARQIAELLGFQTQDQTRIATAVSEIARNAYQYVGKGKIEFKYNQYPRSNFNVTVSDNGPGIKDATHSKSGSPKFGILGAKRMVDTFHIDSGSEQGTIVNMGMYLPRDAPVITIQRLGDIANQLIRHRPASVSDEVLQQNQELLQAYELLSKARDELEHRVTERTSELVKLNQQLQQEILVRKETEQSLRIISDQLNLALKAARMGIWSWDIIHNSHFWDNNMYPLFGLAKDSSIAGFENHAQLIHPDDRELLQTSINQAIENNSFLEIEFRVVWLDNETHHLMIRGEVKRSESGIAEKVLGVCWDITEIKQSQAAFIQYQQQMAQINRTSSMGEMASTLAHELNQPLTSISAFARGCVRRLESKHIDPDKLFEIMKEIAEQSERAGQIIHRMKNFVRKGKLFYEQVDIETLLGKAVKLIHYEHTILSVKIALEVQKNLPKLSVDPIQIEQIILNLLRNSIEAMAEAHTTNPTIQIQVVQSNYNFITVSVIDNGPGLDESEAGKLFEPYFTTKTFGTGLGLAICRTLIEAHGGHLLAKPNLEGGACFYFTLPIEVNNG